MRRDIDDWSLAIMGFDEVHEGEYLTADVATDCPGKHGPYAPHSRRAAAPRLPSASWRTTRVGSEKLIILRYREL
jgi:hypothetical protein